MKARYILAALVAAPLIAFAQATPAAAATCVPRPIETGVVAPTYCVADTPATSVPNRWRVNVQDKSWLYPSPTTRTTPPNGKSGRGIETHSAPQTGAVTVSAPAVPSAPIVARATVRFMPVHWF